MIKQMKILKNYTPDSKNSSCAKNFMLSELMMNHPIYAQYADFYRTIAIEELSEIKKSKDQKPQTKE